MITLAEFLFLGMAVATSVVGFLINTLEEKLPLVITQSFRYGKFAQAGKSIEVVRSAEVPKSYFKHFYVSATILSIAALVTAVRLYMFKVPVSPWLIKLLDFFCGENRQATTSVLATLLVLTLLTLQCIRRLYETFCVQVFAKNSKIFLTHYLIGHFHYIGCLIVVLGKSAGFTRPNSGFQTPPFVDSSTVVLAVPAVYIFLFAWLNQFRSNKILASLRKDKSSKIVSQKYFLPVDGWFRFISCPHLLCEILIYVSLTLLLVKNSSWLYILFWVLSNQVETALLSHWWYQKTFPELPKERKALIPYVL